VYRRLCTNPDQLDCQSRQMTESADDCPTPACWQGVVAGDGVLPGCLATATPVSPTGTANQIETVSCPHAVLHSQGPASALCRNGGRGRVAHWRDIINLKGSNAPASDSIDPHSCLCALVALTGG
jgi:hypothetical protein